MKKGLSLVVMDYPFVIFGPFSVFISVYAGDGTVAISHGGTECGQGINTKVLFLYDSLVNNNELNDFHCYYYILFVTQVY